MFKVCKVTSHYGGGGYIGVLLGNDLTNQCCEPRGDQLKFNDKPLTKD